MDACDIYLKICVTEVPQTKCNADTFQTKVLGDETSFSFPGIGGDLGNGKNNPLEYTFQKWQVDSGLGKLCSYQALLSSKFMSLQLIILSSLSENTERYWH